MLDSQMDATGECINGALRCNTPMSQFQPRFDVRTLAEWALHYGDSSEDAEVVAAGRRAGARGWFTRDEFLLLGDWKSPRARKRRIRNDAEFVRDVTGTALTTPSERLRIEVLTLLDGVDWPTASVILHLAHRERYPILDVRALWSLGADSPPAYDCAFWLSYVETCRTLADKSGLDMRTLDRALWGFSKANQARAGS